MIPIGPHCTAPMEGAVQASREADRESLDAATPRLWRVGFGDEVDVIVLDAEMEDAKSAARGAADADANGSERARLAQ